MKKWFSKIFGKEQKPPPAGGNAAVAPQADAERTMPADIGRTVLASKPNDPQAIHAAEAEVATEWKLWDLSGGQCLRIFAASLEGMESVAISPDGRWGLSGGESGTLHLWELDWEYEFPGWTDWDEGARPYLSIFLTLHCPTGPDGFARVGRPAWTELDFQKLLTDLHFRGFGWLRPEGVRRELEQMTAEWQGPPAVPWESTK